MRYPVFLDNNSTTPVDPEVIQEILRVLEKHPGNPSSSTHSYGWFAQGLVEKAREQVSALLGAKPEEIVFTSGATEANNLALKGFFTKEKAGLLLTTELEHSAVFDPILKLESEGIEIVFLKLDKDGSILLEEFQNTLEKFKADNRPKLISLMLANNEIGVIHNLERLFSLAKEAGFITHSDATQALGKLCIDVSTLYTDLLSISAHKVYGPKGVGALYARQGIKLSPLLLGGGHEAGLRSGTLNVAGIVGFGKACELAQKNLESEPPRLRDLGKKLFEELKEKIPELNLNGPIDFEKRLPGNLNFCLKGCSASTLMREVSSDIAISAGSACQSSEGKPSRILKALGLSDLEASSSIRIGIGRFNTEEDIKRAADVLVAAYKKLRS